MFPEESNNRAFGLLKNPFNAKRLGRHNEKENA
jgi:hypothetical protein